MSGAQARVADTLLRSVGGRTVLLHIPAPAVQGDLGEQVGLAAPLFQDVALGPAVFRKIRPRIATAQTERVAQFELLVSASAVLAIVGSLGYRSADLLFGQACGVLVDGALLGITSVTSAEAFGSVYLYRLGLRAAAADLV
jgi:hypothetical protein